MTLLMTCSKKPYDFKNINLLNNTLNADIIKNKHMIEVNKLSLNVNKLVYDIPQNYSKFRHTEIKNLQYTCEHYVEKYTFRWSLR